MRSTTAASPGATRATPTAPLPTSIRRSSSIANYAVALYNRGNAYYEKKDYDRAIADYDAAIKLNPNYAAAYNSRGLAYDEKRDSDRAIADFSQSIKLNPNDPLVYNNRGFAYRNKGDTDRAIADYQQAIKLDPNYALALYNRGIAYYDKRDFDRASADLNAGDQDQSELRRRVPRPRHHQLRQARLRHRLPGDGRSGQVRAELRRSPRTTAPASMRTSATTTA